MAINNSSSTCASADSLTASAFPYRVKSFEQTGFDTAPSLDEQTAAWAERLRQCDGFKLDWLNPRRGEVGAVRIVTRRWTLDNARSQALAERVNLSGEDGQSDSVQEPLALILMTAVAAYLARLSDEPSGAIAFRGAAQRAAAAGKIAGAADTDMAGSVPLSICLELAQPLGDAVVRVAEELKTIAALGSYPFALLADAKISAPVLPVAVTCWAKGETVSAAQAEVWPNGQLVNLVLNGAELLWQYDAARLDEPAIARFEAGLESLLTGFLTEPTQPLLQLPLLSAGERQQVLLDWNQTARDGAHDYDWDCCTHRLFEQQVEQSADRPALQFGEQQLTYAELNQRANQVAHGLLAQGIQPDDIVAIHQDRSIELIISVVGVLKAGAAYLPLDPEYPRDRLMLMVEDARPKVILTQRDRQGQLGHDCEFCMDDASLWTDQPTENPVTAVQSHHLAYIIYTSGSTGRPKGVMIEHRGLSNYIQAARQLYSIQTQDRMLQFASISFDAAA